MAGLSISKISHLPRTILQRTVNAVPKMTVNSEKAIKTISWIGEKISSPENRLILGVTALMCQPFIDLHNKDVDKKTREVSAARTVAKIIAGTSTGVLIRYGCIKAIDAFTKMPHEITEGMKHKNLLKLFTPSPKVVKSLQNNLNLYKKSLGTILAVFIMVFTNFLIDAPFTKFLTNKFIGFINKRNEKINQNKQENPATTTTNPTNSKQIKEAKDE